MPRPTLILLLTVAFLLVTLPLTGRWLGEGAIAVAGADRRELRGAFGDAVAIGALGEGDVAGLPPQAMCIRVIINAGIDPAADVRLTGGQQHRHEEKAHGRTFLGLSPACWTTARSESSAMGSWLTSTGLRVMGSTTSAPRIWSGTTTSLPVALFWTRYLPSGGGLF